MAWKFFSRSDQRITPPHGRNQKSRRLARRLQFELLEGRSLLAGDLSTEKIDFGIPPEPTPPESYRSAKISDLLAEVAYEFDRWAASSPNRDFASSNSVIQVNDGRVGVEAIAAGSSDALVTELQGIGADIVAVGSTGTNAWVPLSRIEDLAGLVDLQFAGPPLGIAQTQIASADDAVVSSSGTLAERSVSASGEVGHIDISAAPGPSVDDVPTRYRSPRVSDLLAQASYQYDQARSAGNSSSFAPSNGALHTNNGEILVEAVTTGSPNDLATGLKHIGASVVAVGTTGVSAWVPLTQVPELDTVSGLTFAGPSLSVAVTSIGSATTQGDTVMKSDQARSAFALNGSGQKVGVISDSFDLISPHASADIASGDLPGTGNPNGYITPVQNLGEPSLGSFYIPSPKDEGRAMLQIVHDVAPAAHLAFKTADGGKFGMQSAIQSLQSNGATVIVDDITYLDEPMYMDGVVAQAASAAVAAGIPYVSAAGNSGNLSYEASQFVPTSATYSYGRTVGGIPRQSHHNFPTSASASITISEFSMISTLPSMDWLEKWTTEFHCVAVPLHFLGLPFFPHRQPRQAPLRLQYSKLPC